MPFLDHERRQDLLDGQWLSSGLKVVKNIEPEVLSLIVPVIDVKA
ncbi:hypothetical protein [Vibrio hyugaensis]|nr:hypothetical protein [Vibrio hyugaensis]